MKISSLNKIPSKREAMGRKHARHSLGFLPEGTGRRSLTEGVVCGELWKRTPSVAARHLTEEAQKIKKPLTLLRINGIV
jgi:hypothetical protein